MDKFLQKYQKIYKMSNGKKPENLNQYAIKKMERVIRVHAPNPPKRKPTHIALYVQNIKRE